MTFKIEKKTLDHRGGTKQYHTLFIHNTVTKATVVLFRWGKTGAWGQVAVEKHASWSAAHASVSKKLREKEAKGYSVKFQREWEAETDEDFAKHVGAQYISNMGVDALTFVKPDAKTDGVRDPDSMPDWKRNEKGELYDANAKKPRTVEERAPTVEDRVAVNPNWGLF